MWPLRRFVWKCSGNVEEDGKGVMVSAVLIWQFAYGMNNAGRAAADERLTASCDW